MSAGFPGVRSAKMGYNFPSRIVPRAVAPGGFRNPNEPERHHATNEPEDPARQKNPNEPETRQDCWLFQLALAQMNRGVSSFASHFAQALATAAGLRRLTCPAARADSWPRRDTDSQGRMDQP